MCYYRNRQSVRRRFHTGRPVHLVHHACAGRRNRRDGKTGGGESTIIRYADIQEESPVTGSDREGTDAMGNHLQNRATWDSTGNAWQSESITARKDALRRTLRARERQFPAESWREAGHQMAERLFRLPLYQTAHTVCCFVSTDREPDTRPILAEVLNAGKRLCVPLCLGPGKMEMRRLPSFSALSPGAMGILEPDRAAEPVEPGEIDLALIPCLSCDPFGNRLGRGGGYYDRFLARYPGAAVLLCREAMLCAEIPVQDHDIPIPLVLTEAALYRDGKPLPEAELRRDGIALPEAELRRDGIALPETALCRDGKQCFDEVKKT